MLMRSWFNNNNLPKYYIPEPAKIQARMEAFKVERGKLNSKSDMHRFVENIKDEKEEEVDKFIEKIYNKVKYLPDKIISQTEFSVTRLEKHCRLPNPNDKDGNIKYSAIIMEEYSKCCSSCYNINKLDIIAGLYHAQPAIFEFFTTYDLKILLR